MSFAMVASTASATAGDGSAAASHPTAPSQLSINGNGGNAIMLVNGDSDTTINGQRLPQQKLSVDSSESASSAYPHDASNNHDSDGHHSTSAAPATDSVLEIAVRAGSAAEKNDPLPAELRRLLTEVASTGTCLGLAWSTASPREQQRPPGSARVSSSGVSTAETTSVAQLSDLMRENRPSMSAWTATGTRQNPLLVAALQHHSTTLNHQQQRRFQTSSPTGAPPRKKLRNGLHGVKINRRFCDSKANPSTVTGSVGLGASRKRSLVKVLNTIGLATIPTAVCSSSAFSPGSVESGRTSGSEEPEDTSQSYDSEGTSASDFSGRKVASSNPPLRQPLISKSAQEHVASSYSYSCQKDAFRVAIQLVLDYFFQNKGGYTLSPAEKLRIQSLSAAAQVPVRSQQPVILLEKSAVSAEEVYLHRRACLLNLFEPSSSPSSFTDGDGPPFTIQRVAEVLISPERYYSQTHKLCNALEKMLLITSSAQAFGGYSGGATSQSLREDQEMSALSEERRRIQLELRRRRLRQRNLNSALDEQSDTSRPHHNGNEAMDGRSRMRSRSDPESHGDEGYTLGRETSEIMEAAARASLRTKFDHVGMESAVNRDARASSPPPPNLSISASVAPGYALPGHGGYSPPGIARAPSPILFHTSDGGSSSPTMGPIHANAASMNLLQLHHHATSLAGSPPIELMSLHHQTSPPASFAPSSILTSSMMPSKEVDFESRSSASSDVDSESDVSFDDSASDRSDGSDLDSGAGHISTTTSSAMESISAARAMTLSWMQQQQHQRMQSRMISAGAATTMMTTASSPSLLLLHQHSTSGGESPSPPGVSFVGGVSNGVLEASFPVQRATEDSGGSDSSSSDVAD